MAKLNPDRIVPFRFRYDFKLTLSEDAIEHLLVLRMHPFAPGLVRVARWHFETEPRVEFSQENDVFGQPRFFGSIKEAHRSFAVHVEGEGSRTAYLRPERGPWFELFRGATDLISGGPVLESWWRLLIVEDEQYVRPRIFSRLPQKSNFVLDVWRSGKSATDIVELVCAFMAERFAYHADYGGDLTSAEQAAAGGFGVSQDYVHIALWFLRRLGVSSRYVAGFVAGEYRAQAWLEYWDDTVWRGYDPLHRRPVESGYLPFCIGRDSQDCILNRGIFKGGGNQSVEAKALVEEI